MSARTVIVGEVAAQGAAQVAFAKDEDVIQTLAPDRADEPLRERILPWAVRLGDVEGEDAPAMVSEHDEDE